MSGRSASVPLDAASNVVSSAAPAIAPVITVADGEAARGEVTDELAALIGSVTFGSSGLRYRRLEISAQLERLHDPAFVLARDGDALVGACVLDRRALLVAGRETPGVYRGSLCVAPGRTGQGIGRALADAAREWIDAEARAHGTPVLSWGCIERDNRPSLAVLEASGARDAGGLAMPMAYRQRPRERLALERLAPGRDAREAAVLEATHADALVRDVTPSRLAGLASIDADGVRVSARVVEASYAIETMGTATDALVRVFVTPFPWARRRFDPARFRHVRLVDVALREGCERDWPRFVSTLLARHDAHFALTFVDPTSALAARLGKGGGSGSRRASSSASLRVMTRWSAREECATELPGGPLALAPVDG